MTYLTENGGVKYIITSKNVRDVYWLYEVKNGELIKKHQAQNPSDFEKYIKW